MGDLLIFIRLNSEGTDAKIAEHVWGFCSGTVVIAFGACWSNGRSRVFERSRNTLVPDCFETACLKMGEDLVAVLFIFFDRKQ